ncbi:hypothetical protein HAX54_042258, partial [Datura stramonium]|nr:hypothetical protein [Datura stramonium]
HRTGNTCVTSSVATHLARPEARHAANAAQPSAQRSAHSCVMPGTACQASPADSK